MSLFTWVFYNQVMMLQILKAVKMTALVVQQKPCVTSTILVMTPVTVTQQLMLIWEKVSDKILEDINNTFDKLEQTLQIVQRYC